MKNENEKNTFKVGDRVVCTGERYGYVMKGETGTIVYLSNVAGVEKIGVRWDKAAENRHDCDGICAVNHGYFVLHDEIKKLMPSVHIYANGPVVTAVLKDGNKAVKTAAARCNPADTFDFAIGSRLAFSRLMGEEATVEPEKPKLLNCKFVVTCGNNNAEFEVGHIYTVKDGKIKGKTRVFPLCDQVLTDWESLVRYFDGEKDESGGFGKKFWTKKVFVLRIEE